MSARALLALLNTARTCVLRLWRVGVLPAPGVLRWLLWFCALHSPYAPAVCRVFSGKKSSISLDIKQRSVCSPPFAPFVRCSTPSLAAFKPTIRIFCSHFSLSCSFLDFRLVLVWRLAFPSSSHWLIARCHSRRSQTPETSNMAAQAPTYAAAPRA